MGMIFMVTVPDVHFEITWLSNYVGNPNYEVILVVNDAGLSHVCCEGLKRSSTRCAVH